MSRGCHADLEREYFLGTRAADVTESQPMKSVHVNVEVCKTRTFVLGDKPHSFFAPEGKPPRRGLNPRPLACGNNLPKFTLGGHLSYLRCICKMKTITDPTGNSFHKLQWEDSRTLYDEFEEDSVDEDDIVDLGNDGEIRNEYLDDYSE
nr:hypothetical protein [Tanacetum cinerariifolium]